MFYIILSTACFLLALTISIVFLNLMLVVIRYLKKSEEKLEHDYKLTQLTVVEKNLKIALLEKEIEEKGIEIEL